MKRFVVIFLLATIAVMPFCALAQPTVLHDDGEYLDYALAAEGQLVAAAVLMPTVMQVTFLNTDGTRLGWTNFSLPESIWELPKQNISLQLRLIGFNRYELTIPLTAGDAQNITYAALYTAQVMLRNNSVSVISSPLPQVLTVPDGARDMRVLAQPTSYYVIWRTADEDNISTVLIERFNRLMATNSIRRGL